MDGVTSWNLDDGYVAVQMGHDMEIYILPANSNLQLDQCQAPVEPEMLNSYPHSEKCSCLEYEFSWTILSCILHCPSSKRRDLRFLSDFSLERMLERYLLSSEELQNGGFPCVYQEFRDCAYIFKQYNPLYQEFAFLNPDAQGFFPGQDQYLMQQEGGGPLLRKCKRCPFFFPVDRETGDYLFVQECIYHPGKYLGHTWLCCGESKHSNLGCTTAKDHIWSGYNVGHNGPLSGFVQTRNLGSCSSYGVFAVDCEMSYTKNGMELIRVSVVKLDGVIIYDQLVKPSEEIIDYCTEIHGITEEEISNATKTLVDVQNDLLQFIHAESILLGHSLENDLLALRIIHNRIIDTSYLFPHEKGFPYRYSLKTLAKRLLKTDIQITTHDSTEDARVAMDVMLCKIEDDLENHVFM